MTHSLFLEEGKTELSPRHAYAISVRMLVLLKKMSSSSKRIKQKGISSTKLQALLSR
jgi:hypothetical protein